MPKVKRRLDPQSYLEKYESLIIQKEKELWLLGMKKYLEGMIDQQQIKGISLARSDSMHEAANEAVDHGKVGIWKIGQKHVEDIEKKESTEIKYELTDRLDFNKDMGAFDKGGGSKNVEQQRAEQERLMETDWVAFTSATFKKKGVTH